MWLFPAGETTGLGDWYFGFSRPGEKLPVVQSVRTSGQRAVDECTHVPTSLNQPSSNQHSNPAALQTALLTLSGMTTAAAQSELRASLGPNCYRGNMYSVVLS